MTPTDEVKLSWYFGHGQTAFERSTSGPMLERAELYGHAGALVWSERADGYSVDARRIGRPSSPWASVEDGEIVATGYAITARPTAELRQASGYVPESRAMELFAVVSSVLKELERRSPVAVAALEAYYGDVGSDWARTPKPGRIGSLYHLTGAGVRLLDVSADEARKKGQPVAGSPARRMANEVSAPKIERRRVALMRADKQALELRAMAFVAWCEAKAERKARRAA